MSDDDGPMTVAKLRDLLHDLPGDHLVVMSKDAEGNDYREFSGDISTQYRWRADWRELVGDDDEEGEGDSDDEDPDDDEEDDEPDESVPCIVLWPV